MKKKKKKKNFPCTTAIPRGRGKKGQNCDALSILLPLFCRVLFFFRTARTVKVYFEFEKFKTLFLHTTRVWNFDILGKRTKNYTNYTP